MPVPKNGANGCRLRNYNTSYHSALKRTPFEVLFGYHPRILCIQSGDVCQVPELSNWQERELMSQVIKQHLLRALIRMKHQADKKHSEVSFAVGEQVFLKLQPYAQSSLANCSHQIFRSLYYPGED
jgi:hypothetical protein